MQIDGHHTMTYVAARSAGFSHDESATIAYAAQYVDDATNAGPILFRDSAYLYARIASAHSMIDYNNLFKVQNHLAWLPFHFLPGNGGLPAGEDPVDGELGKLFCRPDSHVARDMLRYAMKDRGSKRELHRLGIAMHVYADTFAHQGFIGANSMGNNVEFTDPDEPEIRRILGNTMLAMLKGVANKTKNVLILLAYSAWLSIRARKSLAKFWKDFLANQPLGHAEANVCPDMPYLEWRYKGWNDQLLPRNNPDEYIEAIQKMTRAMQAWRAGDTTMQIEQYSGMAESDLRRAQDLINDLRHPNGNKRHRRWLEVIRNGEFSFGAVAALDYRPKGKGSWKAQALRTTRKRDSGYELYEYSPGFLESDWKLFHDALQVHRSDVVHEILPQYGICAA